MDDIADENKGLVSRRAYLTKSKTLQLIGRSHSDIFYQNRYLMNGVDLKLKLIRNTNALVLMGDAAKAYKLKIQNASFLLEKLKSTQEFSLNTLKN